MNKDLINNELIFSVSRSGGKGGQNVNKVSTKVELHFHIQNSNALNDDEKLKIKVKLKNKINSEGFLHLYSQKTRSQIKNKQDVIEKFFYLLDNSLLEVKKRKKSKPTIQSKEKRLETKKIVSLKKKLRSGKFE
ncbi:MAG TPA: alternative ribosome rescue aminoacyl-tRNA hydrolase ArfB [Ignavibacteria bacterium]|nr:alternative ribosome rescue aminoacyl-tRNA hydrolase ArfB [Ignavibacteria bacterium]